jgi:hypothetical protein
MGRMDDAAEQDTEAVTQHIATVMLGGHPRHHRATGAPRAPERHPDGGVTRSSVLTSLLRRP